MKKGFIFSTLLAFVFLSLILWWVNGSRPVSSKNKEEKLFVINRGETVREIGKSLKDEGLIRDPIIFFLYVKKLGLDKSIQAGDYKLSPSMDLSKVLDTLHHGTLDIWITVPEGYRAEEIADLLKKSVKTYNNSWREKLNSNEGYLFPDTYLIPTNADIDSIISIMRNNLDKKLSKVGLDSKSSDINKIIILASLVEREAITDEEKPILAGIMKNRLSSGMPLQIDATIQYAKGFSLSKNKWWLPVTVDEYKSVKSLYNTYLYPGLPPGPISNPGVVAIQAAASPASTEYNYYLHDMNGKVHYSRTYEEHQENIERFLQ